MNARIALVLGICLVFLVLATPLYCANVIANGNMESITAGQSLPSGWSYANYGTGSQGAAYTPGYNSQRCIRIQNPSLTSKANIQPVSFPLALEAGCTVTVSAISKAENVVMGQDAIYGISMKLLYSDGTAGWLITSHTPGTHDWEYKERTVTLEKNVVGYEYLVVYFYNCSGTACFDNVSVTVSGDPVFNSDMEFVSPGGNLPLGWKFISYNTGAQSAIDTPGCSGERCVRITNQNITDKANIQPQTFDMDMEAGSTITISGMSKAENVVKGENDSCYGLSLKLIYADGSSEWMTTSHSPGTHDWEYRECNVLLRKSVVGYEYFVMYFYNCQGTAWFDDVKITVSGNLISNGTMETSTVGDPAPSAWKYYDYGSGALVSVVTPGYCSGRATRIVSPSTADRAYIAPQVVDLNLEAGTRLTISGMSKAENVVKAATGAIYGLSLKILYADGTAGWLSTSDFSSGTHDWEYRENSIVLKKDVVGCEYFVSYFYYCSGTAWFDNISITASSNDLGNGTMENIADGDPLPYGWTFIDYFTNSEAGAYNPGYSSNTCIRIVNPSTADKANIQPWRFNLHAAPGSRITISGMSKAESVVRAATGAIYGLSLKILYADGTAGWLSTSDFSSGTHDWEYRENSVVVQKEVIGYEYFVSYFYNCQGTVYFDNISVAVTTPRPYESLKFYTYADSAYISPDMPVSMGIGAMHNLGDISGRDVRLALLLPSGIDLAGFCPAPASVDIGQPVIRNGITYQPRILHFSSLPSCYANWGTAFFSSTLSAGQERIVYFNGLWDNGSQEEQAIRMTSIGIQSTQMMTDFLVGTAIHSYNTMNAWPNFAANYKNIGFNIVDLYDNYVIQNPAFDQGLETAVADCQQNGLIVMGDGNFLCSSDFLSTLPADAQALQSDGLPYNGGTVVCPSYRGTALEDNENLEAVPGYVKYGTSWRNLDAEPWNFAGDKICFCQRCCSEFETYFLANYPGIPYVAPQVFDGHPDLYPELCAAWLDYKIGNFDELFAEARQRMEDECLLYGMPGFVLSANLMAGDYLTNREKHLVDAALFLNNGSLDYVAPMIYCEGSGFKLIGEWIRDINSRLIPAKKRHIIAYLLSGYGTYVPQPNEIRNQLLETMMAGASGAVFWKLEGFNALMLKEVSDITRMMRPLSYILAGGNTELLQSMGATVPQVETVTLNNEKLVLVSHYLTNAVISGNVQVPVAVNSEVVDLDTGAVVAQITPGNPVFQVTLSTLRAKIYYIRPE